MGSATNSYVSVRQANAGDCQRATSSRAVYSRTGRKAAGSATCGWTPWQSWPACLKYFYSAGPQNDRSLASVDVKPELIDNTPTHLTGLEPQVEHDQMRARLNDETVRVLPTLQHEDLVAVALE